MDINLGIVAAIVAAAVWAASSVILASQLSRVDAAMISALRLSWAALLFLVVMATRGGVGDIIDLGWSNSLQLIAGAIVGLAIGDTLYVISLGVLGASRAFTASLGLFTVFTFSLSAVVLDEPITGPVIGGSALVLGSVYLVTLLGSPTTRDEYGARVGGLSSAIILRGLALIVVAAACWAIATVWLGHAAGDTSAVAVGAIRIPAAALVVGALVSLRRGSGIRIRAVPLQAMVLLAVAGIIGTGIGSWLFVYAIQEAGAGKTAVLSSLSPLFAVPLGAIWLKEPITPWVIVGAVLAVVGIVLISI